MDSLSVLAPVTGRVVAMSSVPDPVFAQAMVGPGLAIEPDPERGRDVVSPLSGTVVKLHPHAFVVAAASGRGVLVHLGIDTVQLHGEGFTVHVAEGDAVTAGQPVVSWSPRRVSDGGRSPVVPVVALDAAAEALVPAAVDGDLVEAGDALFDVEE
ncbi:PTS glucose transporter subunit IIA [Isoptericola variabilis]|uniref:PTS system, glucose subfamily, IIA subunit n=1 Tax=Isoptericola variabilis (strain 225) TaxID=743718 RepID=F6FST9_ISOV2|nr:PTS glucose transporter subunit IIA [Isoptericola variabilis]AEG43080.1 PTS system, glucose subfamily, IIA subunit [Isoptericola variabilis 225]TWH35006.1 PTS system N-acetylglucosamine-specific IIA component [Isoptericola variabilis J7]